MTGQSEYNLKASDLARELDVSRKTVLKRTRALGLGINLEGRAGYRFSEADRQRLFESMRPEAPVARKRRRAA